MKVILNEHIFPIFLSFERENALLLIVTKYQFRQNLLKITEKYIIVTKYWKTYLRIRCELREHVLDQRRGREHDLDGVGEEHEGRRLEGDPDQLVDRQLHHSLGPSLKKHSRTNVAYANWGFKTFIELNWLIFDLIKQY